MHVMKSKREKEVDKRRKTEVRRTGWGRDRGRAGQLTSSEQTIPVAKHAMKPFILVPQLKEDASTT